MKTGWRTIAVLGLTLSATLPAVWATDVGMPLDSSAIGKNANVEFYYELYNRNIKQDFSGGTDTGKQEENRFIARINYYASSRAALYAEIGATDSDQSEGAVPLFGAGLKIKVYDSSALNVNAFASATYINEIQYKHDGYVDYNEPGYVYVDHPDFSQKESYFEINGGLIISKLIQLDEKTTCTPYGGFMVSKLDGDEDYEFTYHVQKRTEKESGDLKDDGLLSLFAGLGLTLGNTWGMRFEGRFVNQTSFSVGLSYLF